MLNPADHARAVERTRKLHLLGFTKDEQKAIIETELKTVITHLEFEDIYQEMRGELSVMPELTDIKHALGETWSRASLLQNDLLGVYQQMLRNFNAHMRGLREHEDDGTPVIAVRPSEIAAMADRISKFDQERTTSMMNAAKALQMLAPPAPPSGGPPPPSVLMAGLADDPDEGDVLDADFEATH